ARAELNNMNINHIGVGVKVTQDVRVHMDGMSISDAGNGIWSRGTNTPAQINGPSAPPLKVVVTNSKVTGTSIGILVEARSFLGSGNEISFSSTDSYLIKSYVTSCSGVAMTGYFNKFTGI